MAWKGSGEDRIKRYHLYQELEARYLQVQKEKEALAALIAQKDRTIRHLASELAHSATVAPTASPETFSEAADQYLARMAETLPEEPQAPTSSRPTSNAPPIGKSEMRPARTSVANGEGKALGQSIRDRLAAGQRK